MLFDVSAIQITRFNPIKSRDITLRIEADSADGAVQYVIKHSQYLLKSQGLRGQLITAPHMMSAIQVRLPGIQDTIPPPTQSSEQPQPLTTRGPTSDHARSGAKSSKRLKKPTDPTDPASRPISVRTGNRGG